MKYSLTFCLFLILTVNTFSQPNKNTVKKFDYFASAKIFPLLYLNPLACIVYGGIHVFYENGSKNKGVYIPVTLGFSKPFITYTTENIKIETGLEAASFTQFEIVHIERNTYLGGLQNNDYKASGYLSAAYNDMLYKIQLFHISSHLGDDYMIRNENFSRNDKSVNYEQIDFTLLKQYKYIDYYFGTGWIITPNAFRKRFSGQTGFQYTRTNKQALNFMGGINIKLDSENEFYPDTRIAIGAQYFKEKPAFRLQLEFFHGHIPYSTLKMNIISWIGISTVLEI